MKTELKWLKRSNYCIASECGKYRIAKVVLSGEEWFLLHADDKRLGMWRGDATAAKRAAQAHSNSTLS